MGDLIITEVASSLEIDDQASSGLYTHVIRDRGAPGSDLIAVHNELIIPKKLEKS